MSSVEEYVEYLSLKWRELTGRNPKYIKESLLQVARVVGENLGRMSTVQIGENEVLKNALDIYFEVRMHNPRHSRHCNDLNILALTALHISLASRGIPVNLEHLDTDTLTYMYRCYKSVAKLTGKYAEIRARVYREIRKVVLARWRQRAKLAKLLKQAITLSEEIGLDVAKTLEKIRRELYEERER